MFMKNVFTTNFRCVIIYVVYKKGARIMNQILSVDNNNNNYENKGYKSQKKADTKAVVIFFCVVLIIFGFFIIGNGVYSIYNKTSDEANNDNDNTKVAASEEIDISVQVVSETEIGLIITHNQEIKSVEYSWNDEEPIVQDGKEKNNVEISNIEVPPGKDNKLSVKATDVNGNEKTYTNTFESPERPWIKLSSEQNAIKVEVESKTEISYITYSWDDDEPKRYTINAPKTMKTLEVKEEGEHTLKITAVDTQGNEATKSQKIKGARVPVVKVTTDGENFIIRATDEEEIDKISVNINGKEMEKTINQKDYTFKIKLSEGENRITVTVYNKSGIKKEEKRRTVKE